MFHFAIQYAINLNYVCSLGTFAEGAATMASVALAICRKFRTVFAALLIQRDLVEAECLESAMVRDIFLVPKSVLSIVLR